MLDLPAILRFWRPKTTSGLERELDKARLSQLITHLPLLYSILCINVITTCITFAHVAPGPLVSIAPGALLIASISRALYWRSRRGKPIDAARTREMLHSVHFFALCFGCLYTIWTMGLYRYGDAALRTQVVYTVVITMMVCTFTLAHIPRVALMLSCVGLPGFLVLLTLTGGRDSPIIALNLTLVAVFLAYMVAISARDFEKMVAAQVRSVELADENRLLANTDSLTGLPNRREFFARLERAIDAAADGGGLIMGVIDLDGFKPINDLYGHAIGDRVLRECAARLELFVGGGTNVARLGGDEFGIFVKGHFDDRDIHCLGSQICAALRAPLRFADIHAGVSCSIGFSRYPQDAMDAHRLYERADYALYFGKQNQRGEPVLFSPDHENKMLLNARIEQALRDADLENEFSVEFQPLFQVKSRRIVAFEALARWTSRDLGAVPADVFISIAECSEIIHAITRTILRKALNAARDWPDGVRLSFNLSIRDLVSEAAMTQIFALIASSGFDPARLDIEVGETALVADFERASKAIGRLKALGVNISLDDFGAGYSSLAYVHRLPLDRIKIDRSFIRELHSSAIARDIVKSMIALCGNLNLKCATEGVETVEQLDLLREFGCNFVQGYLFGHPVSAADVAPLISQTNGHYEARTFPA